MKSRFVILKKAANFWQTIGAFHTNYSHLLTNDAR
jgi:hypothetical protein